MTKPKDIQVGSISMHDMRDMLGGPGCGDWIQFCEDNKGKYNDQEMVQKYEEYLLSKDKDD